mmetsp:Transcript_16709/g.29978  ORF Transcript_16709/g.29978 Transcript_16709/m.29978 type:complete len:81 (-) Transcript_16709:50-292(-)
MGRTVVIVAHRLSTIRRANQIVVMSDHKIVDVGSHQKLLASCGKYQELIKRQSVISHDLSSQEFRAIEGAIDEASGDGSF